MTRANLREYTFYRLPQALSNHFFRAIDVHPCFMGNKKCFKLIYLMFQFLYDLFQMYCGLGDTTFREF